jgi:hypothetical protein
MASRTEYTYTARGRRDFPIDMLRYDRATPKSEGDSHEISNSLTHHFYRGVDGKDQTSFFMVTLISEKPPTERRWASFGWTVLSEKNDPAYRIEKRKVTV